MLFQRDDYVTEFLPTFLKEDRSYLRKIHERISYAQNYIYIIYPWITLGEELVTAFENALSNNPNLEVYLITKLQREDVFRRIHQLDDVEQWKSIFGDRLFVKYNNHVHSKIIVIDDSEMILGSSNLTGSGLGSSRENEGHPQIEANLYTDDPSAVAGGSNFFADVWNHETSKEYAEDEYVLSCKSHNLSGIFQNYKGEFNKITKREDITFSNNGIVDFKGNLAFYDENKMYLLGNTRKDIAVKFIGDTENLTTSHIGEPLEVSGKLMDVKGCCEFTLMDPDLVDDNYAKISELKSDLARVNVIGMVSKLPREIKDESGRVYLVLIKLVDDTGSVTLELWDDNIPREKIKKGSIVEVINGFTKIYNGELRLGLRKDGNIEIIRGS
ncbi:phospholipase D-like domain-containing protein [Methanobacterium congolense]|uniref:Nucleic acid binding OB-fold tRNA/helicase-type n=1 Tax=Methanobacterium congolense TaxID=118062 RepID=A0A1D3L0Y2_9EURY|nr:phospholipase D-like domain-containing protein [Methanobacterium congolense]SCG85331.1 Nucleic acid binding OB-fold tRNA/helicase-type [Methanobacterium congolense]